MHWQNRGFFQGVKRKKSANLGKNILFRKKKTLREVNSCVRVDFKQKRNGVTVDDWTIEISIDLISLVRLVF